MSIQWSDIVVALASADSNSLVLVVLGTRSSSDIASLWKSAVTFDIAELGSKNILPVRFDAFEYALKRPNNVAKSASLLGLESKLRISKRSLAIAAANLQETTSRHFLSWQILLL